MAYLLLRNAVIAIRNIGTSKTPLNRHYIAYIYTHNPFPRTRSHRHKFILIYTFSILTTLYSCREHQVKDWPIHKSICKKPQNSNSTTNDDTGNKTQIYIIFPPSFCFVYNNISLVCRCVLLIIIVFTHLSLHCFTIYLSATFILCIYFVFIYLPLLLLILIFVYCFR